MYSQLLQRVINRSLDAEMDAHLGYERHAKHEAGRRPNSRNGRVTKTVKGTLGELIISTPRDRNRRIFPNDESAMKSLYLSIREASHRWRGVHNWKPAMQVFQIMFGEERVPVHG